MAGYELKYRAGFASPKNRVGYLEIYQDPLSGSLTDIKIAANGLKLSYTWDDWNSPIIGLRLEFDIVNDKSDYFELLPLLSAEEKEFKVKLVITSPTSYTMFEGFLNCDTTTQKYLYRQTIHFTASSYLSKLDNIHPDSIDILQNKIFINIIDEILVSTGASYNIRVNAKIYAEGDTLLTTQSFLNKNGFYTELFWTDNVERKSSLEILKSILTSFDCYIYWYRGYWYIERYPDIYTVGSNSYVEYTTGVTYGPTSTGATVAIVKAVTDIHDLVFTGQSQTMAILPGMKTIQINLQDKRLINLVTSSFAGMTAVDDTPPAPAFRKWEYSNSESGFHIINNGKPTGIITNAVFRTITLPYTYNVESGIFTDIKFDVVDETTSLNVKFKFIGGFSYEEMKSISFKFHWNLRKAGTANYICQSSENTDVWSLYNASVGDRLQSVTVNGSSFDKNNGSVEVSFNIPLGLVNVIENGADSGKLLGEQEFVLGICTESYKVNDSTNDYYLTDAWFGDVVVTSTGDLQDNVIKGDINSRFLNKKEISVDLYDGLGFDYQNCILRGSNLEYRTERWGTGANSNAIVSRGVCWKTSANPTIADSKTVDGTGIGAFTSKLTGLAVNQLYYVRAYKTDGAGNTVYGSQKTFTTRVLAVGDSYRGGKVAYIYAPGDPGYTFNIDGIQHGIIAAISDQFTNEHANEERIFWGSLSPKRTEGPQAWGTALGQGLVNSGLISAGAVQYSEFANKVCLDYVVGAYSTWYFPSIEELQKLYLNRVAIGGFSENWTLAWYWSSTEGIPGTNYTENHDITYSDENRYAWAVCFGIDAINPSDVTDIWQKNNWMRVRPIQYF